MSWRWNTLRLFTSAFVLFHISALMIWTCPPCAIKERFRAPYYYYVLPLGLWQWWAVFAPDPIRNSITLEAEVIDTKGLRHVYEFPRIGDLSQWSKIPRYRNPKFTANMPVEEYARQRQFTARHAVRQLGLGADSFPLWVSLYHRITDTPSPGTGVSDPLAPTRVQMLDRFEFASLKEVRP
jgi:hypothetical protein